MKKCFKFLLMVCMILCICVKNVEFTYAYVLNTWDLVDSGSHLDWDGETSYMDEWYKSVKTWNAYKPGVIRKDTWKIIEDVDIADYDDEDDNAFAYTSSIGRIRFNTAHMDSFTSAEKQKTITHEIGHALGLYENNNNSNSRLSVMEQGRKSVTKLSGDDKAGYDAAYKKYDD